MVSVVDNVAVDVLKENDEVEDDDELAVLVAGSGV